MLNSLPIRLLALHLSWLGSVTFVYIIGLTRALKMERFRQLTSGINATKPLVFFLMVLFLVYSNFSVAQEPKEPTQGEGSEQDHTVKSASGLALPRFVSISGHEVNLRAGPGLQYPIDWVYRLKGLPLEVIAEYKTWRKVQDWDGTQGWVHQNMLAGKRTFIVIDGPHPIATKPSDNQTIVASAAAGVVGELISCEAKSEWCRVKADGFEGWLKREHFWGIADGETVE